MKKWMVAALAVSLCAAGEKIDEDANWKIRREETSKSLVMNILHKLTDRYGGRLTGSPQHQAAAQWAADQLKEWGLQNAHLEPWKWGHAGWANERAAGYLITPVADTLTLEVLGWTPSTNGLTVGRAVQLVPPASPTKDDLTAWMDTYKDVVAKKAVLIGKAAVTQVSFTSPAKRLDDAEARARFDPVNPTPMNFRRPQEQPAAGKLTTNQINEMLDPWLRANGAVARVNDAGREFGQIRAFANRSYDVAKAVPTVVLRNEDFGRIERLLADGEQVLLGFQIDNRVYPEGETSYNAVAEIPGTDRAGEIVMLGAHLDSWHSATGATDNAIGASVMMEAVRLIQTLGLKPRRTIRIALWSGEEQGLLGSQAYVKEHFGTFEEQKPEYGRISAYFNIDSGTGRVRGANVFGPPEAAAAIRAALAPFEDLGVMGATSSSSRNIGGTDSTSFNAAGLTGIGLMQDPIEYGTTTWHTNLDTYERIVPEDARKSAIVIAAAVWHAANRDEMLPRFAKEKMPPPPKPEGAKPDPAAPPATGSR